jgi:hypothetical protein
MPDTASNSKEDHEVWMRLFTATLTGLISAGQHGVDNEFYAKTAAAAADLALKEVKRRYGGAR